MNSRALAAFLVSASMSGCVIYDGGGGGGGNPPPSSGDVAYLGWMFPPNGSSSAPNCAQAGIEWVDVRIDYGAWTRYPCTEGFNTGGVLTDWLPSGQHSIELEARDADEYMYYRVAGTLTSDGHPAIFEYMLDWSVGGVSVQWDLPGGWSTCASGTATAYVNFWDVEAQAWVYQGYPDSGDPQYCVDGATSVLYNYLQAGTYDVWVTAMDSYGDWLVPVAPLHRITIVPGEFVTSSSPSVMVPLDYPGP